MGFPGKNIIEKLLGYGNCPITGDTYWRTDTVSVPYSRNGGVIVSARALTEFPASKIASVVHKKSRGFSTFARRYSIDEIVEQIPDECTPLQR